MVTVFFLLGTASDWIFVPFSEYRASNRMAGSHHYIINVPVILQGLALHDEAANWSW